MRDREWLKGSAVFSGLAASALSELARIAERKSCGRGEVLFAEGDDARALFLLVEGAVDLVKIAPNGREQLVRSVRRGETFAEAAMFSGEVYPVTAIARRASELIAIRKELFIAFVRAHPDISLAIMGVMARLLRHVNALLADLSLEQVQNRLAAFLLARSRERGKLEFSLGLRKQELAQRLGTIPATLSRNLRRLREQGVIDVRGDFVKIKKIKELEALSGR